MKVLRNLSACGLMVFAVSVFSTTHALGESPPKDITVMTQNQYFGGNLSLVLAAPDEAAFNTALVTALQQIAANDFPRRVVRLAEGIATRRPHLVGLQEILNFKCFNLRPGPPNSGCGDPSIAGAFNDQLSLTLAALRDAGEPYRVVATVENFDLRVFDVIPGKPGLPFQIGRGRHPALLVGVDRDVILARSDVAAAPFIFACALPSVDGCNFQQGVPVITPLGPLLIKRGFVAVEARINKTDHLFVNTHLETLNPTNPRFSFFQAAQASELIEEIEAALTEPALDSHVVTVVGDINSSPDDVGLPGIVPPYVQFVDNGYTDIWAVLDPADGFTCCQQSDLSNATSELFERIDMIFTLESPAKVKAVEVVGDQVSDKTPPPGPALWPSDHGSVYADFRTSRR